MPQLNLLNYYFSLVMAFPVPIAAGVLAARITARHPDERPRELVGRIAPAALAMWLVPLVVVSLGAIFVRNCDWLSGLAHYTMGAGFGVLYGAAVGVLLGRNLPSPGKATLAFALWWLACGLWNLQHFYRHPAIFAYNPFFGYLNGAVYDDTIPISATWAWYRVHTVGLVGLLLALAWRRFRVALVFAAAFVVFTALRGPIGYEITREHIVQTLGGTVETEHFTIHYDASGALADRIDRLAKDHEFRYQQLSDLLGVSASERITSFVYGSHDQKQALMGAGRTYIAKPWTREVHLNAIEVGAGVLKHEIAHVFGAEIAGGPFAVPMQYVVLPKMAIVEGFAVGLTWQKGRLTPHQWSAAMIELGFAADAERILDATGFLGTNAAQAYTLSGSFLRWLLDERGRDRFHVLYRSGSLEEAYGEPPADLARQWRAFLADRGRVPLARRDLDLARYRFDAPSKFHRVCALESAEWEALASQARADGDPERAIELLVRVLSFDPRDPGKRWRLLDALIDGERLDEALAAARALAADEEAGRVLRNRARIREGDVLWLLGRRAEAASVYVSLADEPLDEGSVRRAVASARAAGWARTAIGDGVRDYLLSRGDAANDATRWLSDLALEAPDNALIHYLLGRRLFADEEFAGSIAAHRRALAIGLEDRRLERASLEQQGVAALFSDQPDLAERMFAAAMSLQDAEGTRALLADWIDRCRFWALLRKAT